MTATEDTIVQILDERGNWIDYARTTREAALAAVTAGHLPNNSRPEPMRAVDWITHEEVAVSTKTEETTASTITAPEAAKKIGTDPKLFRRFLRSDASGIEAVGQGNRYAIDPKALPKLKTEFAKWQAEQEAKKAAREAEAAKAAGSKDSTAKPAEEKPKSKTEPKRERTKDIVDSVKEKLAASHREGKHPSNKVPSCPECAKVQAEQATATA